VMREVNHMLLIENPLFCKTNIIGIL